MCGTLVEQLKERGDWATKMVYGTSLKTLLTIRILDDMKVAATLGSVMDEVGLWVVGCGLWGESLMWLLWQIDARSTSKKLFQPNFVCRPLIIS